MRHRRIVLIAALLTGGLGLAGCSTFDPTEWFNTKKTLPGERKAVFPEGVPGVPQGVPRDLVQGYEPAPEPVPEPRVVEPKPKPKPRPRQASAPRSTVTVSPQPAPAQSQGVFPDPPPRR